MSIRLPAVAPLVLSIGLAAALPALAASPEVLRASAALTDLQLTVRSLADLSSQPGVVAGGFTLSVFDNDPAVPTWSDSLLPASPLSYAGSQGHVEVGPDGIRAETAASLDDVVGTPGGLHFSSSPVVGPDVWSLMDRPHVMVAAGSLVTLSGVLTVSYTLDAQPVADWAAAQGNVLDWQLAFGGDRLLFSMNWSAFSADSDVFNASATVDLTTPYNLVGSTDPSLSFSTTMVKPFNLTLVNTTDQEVAVMLDMGVAARTTTSFYVTLDTPPAVPEPATWVLMLAGVAGLGWRASSRRAQHALTA